MQLLVLAALCAASPVRGVGPQAVIPPGQDELLAKMAGRGEVLAGDCRFTGGGVHDPFASLEYTCGDAPLTIELHHPDAVTAAAARTQRFAIVVRRGPAPPELLSQLVGSIRAHEAAFEWKVLPGNLEMRLDMRWLFAGVAALLLLTLGVQVVVSRRSKSVLLPEPPTPAHLRVGLAALIGAYLLPRLWFLTRLPVFIDEAVHIDWARGGFGGSTLPEVLVGKWLPLQFMTLAMWAPLSSLAAVRLASLAMGLSIMLACLRINRALFSAEAGLAAAFVYAVLPFTVFYDHLALADVYVAAFAAWLVYFAVAMVARPTLRNAVALTLCAFATMLSKPTGGLLVAAPLLVALLLVESTARRAYLLRVLPTVLAAAALQALLFVGGFGTGLVVQQSGFALGDEIVHARHNALTLIEWLSVLLTPPLLGAVAIAAAWAGLRALRRQTAELFLVALLLLSVVPYVLVAQKWGPRYVFFAVVPIALLLGRAIAAAAQVFAALMASRGDGARRSAAAIAGGACLVGIGLSTLQLDRELLASPETARLPAIDRLEFIADRSSGYGLPELAEFLRQQALDGPIHIVRFDDTGAAHEGLQVYLQPTDSIQLHTVDATAAPNSEQLSQWTASGRTFFVAHDQLSPALDAAQARFVAGATHRWFHSAPDSTRRLNVWELPRATPTPAR